MTGKVNQRKIDSKERQTTLRQESKRYKVAEPKFTTQRGASTRQAKKPWLEKILDQANQYEHEKENSQQKPRAKTTMTSYMPGKDQTDRHKESSISCSARPQSVIHSSQRIRTSTDNQQPTKGRQNYDGLSKTNQRPSLIGRFASNAKQEVALSLEGNSSRVEIHNRVPK